MRAFHFLQHFQSGFARFTLLFRPACVLPRLFKALVYVVQPLYRGLALLFAFFFFAEQLIVLRFRPGVFFLQLGSLFFGPRPVARHVFRLSHKALAHGFKAGYKYPRIGNAVHRIYQRGLLFFQAFFLLLRLCAQLIQLFRRLGGLCTLCGKLGFAFFSFPSAFIYLSGQLIVSFFVIIKLVLPLLLFAHERLHTLAEHL